MHVCSVEHKLDCLALVYPSQTGVMLNAQTIQTRPNPPSATQKSYAQQPPLRSCRRQRWTLCSLPYPRQGINPSLLWLFFIFYLAPRYFPFACLYRNLETRRFVSLLLDTVAVGDNQSWQRHTPSKPALRRRGDVPKNIAERSDVRASRVFLLLVTMSLLPRSQIAERRLDVRQRRKQHL